MKNKRLIAVFLLAVSVLAYGQDYNHVTIIDTNFDNGSLGEWGPRGLEKLEIDQNTKHAGAASMRVFNRSYTWHGPIHKLTDNPVPGDVYSISAWIYFQDGPNTAAFTFSVERSFKNAAQEHAYQNVTSFQAKKGEWTEIKSVYTISSDPTQASIWVYFELPYKADNLTTPNDKIDFWLDDVKFIKLDPASRPTAGQGSGQTTGAGSSGGQQAGIPTSLQIILNALPAIPIAGNNLKFQFSDNNWTATVNGENFSTGTIELEDTNDGSVLNLKQTHIWPGAAVKTAGRLASRIPGGGAVGGALNAAGSIAGAAGAVEASGPVIVLEYKAGPPARLSYLRSATAASAVLAEPVKIVLADGQWIKYTGAEKESARKDTTMHFIIANQEIDGQIREVLTLITNLPRASGGRWSLVQLTNETIVQTLQKGSGVRFKVLGDGKRWQFLLATNETRSDNNHYEIPIKTQNGKVVEVDIPYSKLKQPAWGKRVPFIKTSIFGLEIRRHSDIGGTGISRIKVFDLEIY